MATTLPTFELTPVNSSRLAAIGYDADDFALYVRFPATKKNPQGKIFRYDNVSEETFDDLKNAESIGGYFGQNIVSSPQKYPFTCVDEGIETSSAEPVTVSTAEILPPSDVIPDDEAGLKSRALATRIKATAITITTADECELASIEVLRVRAERKIVVAKLNAIKDPAYRAWKAASELFNEVDGGYAETERGLDVAILNYRAAARRKAAEEQAQRERIERQAREKAEREQREEHAQRIKAAEEEAERKAAELAEQDAKAAESQGAPAEVVEQIRINPLPVTVAFVAPPPLAYVQPPPPSIARYDIPKVPGLSYATEWFYQITDESQIPFTHEFYTLDEKKINAKVQALKKHANIPGVFVDSRESPIKRTATRRA